MSRDIVFSALLAFYVVVGGAILVAMYLVWPLGTIVLGIGFLVVFAVLRLARIGR